MIMVLHIGNSAMWAAVGYCLLYLLPLVCGCHFPDAVQTNGTQRDWKGHIREQYAEVSLRVEFVADRMRAVATDAFARSFTRVCIQRYGADKYLVAHEERGQREGRYTCVQFVFRGEGIMQIREAELSDRMARDLCDEAQLHTDEWLILDANSAIYGEQPCTIRGGFNMNVFDKSMMKSYCDGYSGQTRLESECRPEHGLNFYFREQSCVPDGLYMYATQRIVCMANWVEEDWNFTLLKHDRYNYMWVMRYPVGSEDRFTVYIFKDLQAPITGTITNTYNYLHISLSLDTVHARTAPTDNPTLCRDDYEICRVLDDPCRYSSDMILTCPRSCGLCNDTVPSLCRFDYVMQSIWADASHPGRASVALEERTLTVEGEETMRCVDWGVASRWESSHQHLRELMLVSDSRHGCRPRYRCARVSMVSPNVMFFQMSQTKMWPLVDDPQDPISCDSFGYEREEVAYATTSSKVKTKHMRLLVSQNRTSTVMCDLSEFRTFDAEFQDGTQCTGQLNQPETLDTFRLTLPGCSFLTLGETYSCIEYARFPPSNDLFLITRSVAVNEILCWLFPKKPSNFFLLIPANQCNEMSKRRMRKGRLSPLATFTKPKRHRSVSKPVLTQRTLSPDNLTEMNDEERLEISINDMVNLTAYMTTNNTSTPGTDLSPSPLVVTALVVTIIGFLQRSKH